MLSVYLTLSFRYLWRRWFYALLIVASIASGVCLLVATRVINQTMDRAAQTTATPMSGAVDLILTSGESPIDLKLAEELKIPGVRAARPRIFETVELADYDNRKVLLIGIDMLGEQRTADPTSALLFSESIKQQYGFVALFSSGKPVIVGQGLDAELGPGKILRVRSKAKGEPTSLTRVGTVDAHGAAASMGGNVLIVDLSIACEVLGLPKGKVKRIDVTFDKGVERNKAREDIARIIAGRAEVRTPDEQNQAVQNVMSGMQTALLLCGIAALVVGLFLVFNALSVSVAERRHEIGILLAVGATRGQIRRLFAGEAVVLGLIGSLLGIPFGLACARFALEPVRGVIEEIFYQVNSGPMRIEGLDMALAVLAGVGTAVLAALVPAIQASREMPAEAVRRMPAPPTRRHRFVQAAISGFMMLVGVLMVNARGQLPFRVGMYGGLALVVVGALLATPLLTALIAKSMQPFVRRWCSLAVRLAADNLVRSPGRTGIVIAALAAGVALFMQTAGTIKSNRTAIRRWVDEAIAADLVITSGSPVSAGGKSKPMSAALGKEFEKVPGVERALAVRLRRPVFQGTQIMMMILNAAEYYAVDSVRQLKSGELDLYRRLAEEKHAVLVSHNFEALHGIGPGDVIPMASPRGPVEFKVIGQIEDYSWNHGTIFVNSIDYDAYWDDPLVDVFDIYLKRGEGSGVRGKDTGINERHHSTPDTRLQTSDSALKRTVQEQILKRFEAEHGLIVLTREEMQDHIDGMIERIYGIAYGQQVVVLFVAALGVVTALLISVLQRRREMGLLRAVGASRGHVLCCVLAEAALMGVIGSLIGFVVGIPLEWFALQVVILEESGYSFPVVVPWLEALLIAVAAILVATLAGIAPSIYAVRQRIPEAIAME